VVSRDQPAPTTWQTTAANRPEQVTAVSYTLIRDTYYGVNGRHYQLDYYLHKGIYHANNSRRYQPEEPSHHRSPASLNDPDRKIANLIWSPNTHYAAYLITIADHIAGSLTHEISLLIYDATTDQSYMVWQGLSGDSMYPLYWSPDSRYLLVEVARQIRRWDQQEAAWVTLTEQPLEFSAISPDGERLLWTNRDEPALYMSDASGNNLVPLASQSVRPRFVDDLLWSPDGRYIAWRNQTALHLIDWQSGQSRRLYHNSQGVGRPTWSPDSRRLAFSAAVNCRWNSSQDYWISGRRFRCDADLFVADVNEAKVYRVTQSNDTASPVNLLVEPSWLTRP
jgi:Tol biopolymer transport system component